MNEIKVIKVQNLNDIELGQINSCANTLFITSTRSLNYQSNKSKKMNVVDFTQLHSQIKSLTKTKNCLSESEMRYLLHKTILDLENKTTKQAYKNSISQIYELFNNLLLSNVTEDCINLKQIKKTHLSSFSDVFQLYIDYLNTLKKQNKQTYQIAFADVLGDYFKQFDSVVLIGFTFFNDVQNLIFRTLIKENKLSSFVTNDDFIIQEFISPLLNDNNIHYSLEIMGDSNCNKFEELRKSIYTNKTIASDLANDILIYKPFFTREMEFKFIIADISSKLKKCSTIEEIESTCNNLAIVVTNQFAKQTQIFNELLRNQGVFISPEKNIYFSREEFLNSNYKNNLPKEERLQQFNQFRRLEMYQPPRTLFNSTLGRFICEIYKLSGNGMKLSNFTTLIHINWLFRNTHIDDVVGEFNTIKDFFENLESIQDWKEQINKLISLKKGVKFEKELHNHPLKGIRLETLEFIQKYIIFIDNVTTRISNVNGNVKKHIKSLIEAIKQEVDDEVIEKQLLSEFEELLTSKDDGVDIDNEYFAQNFQILVSEYLSSKVEKTINIRLNAINLESVNTYDTVYVPMFEENKYPMMFKYEFPYSSEMVDILLDKTLIKNYRLPLNKTLDYNIKLSKYVFENLFRIAKQNIIFTRIESEGGMPLDMSIFGYDIMSKFDNLKEIEINYETVNLPEESSSGLIFKDTKFDNLYLNELLGYFVCPKMFYYSAQFKEKSCYTDKFLLNFYTKALIINRTLSALANGSTYDEMRLKQMLYTTLNSVSNEVFELIPMFDDNNKNDIVLSAKNYITSFVNEKIFTGRYKPKKDFVLSLSKEKVIKHNGTQIKTYSNLVVTDIVKNVSYEFDISKSLDNLISTTGKKQTELKHFWEIVDELERGLPIDRAGSLNFLSFKLNTQLNTPKFNQDGITRVNEVVDTIKNYRKCSNMGFKQSSYCAYCKYKNICLGVVDYE